MSAEINYKNKYMELRSKYMDDLDMAFRLGFEQGGQQAQQDQMMQQQQQAQEVQMAAAQGANQPGQPGQPGEQPPQGADPQMDQSGPNPAEGANGSELDQHIAKLESMIAKSEQIDSKDLQKYLGSLKQEMELKKSAQAISGIAKALHKPAFKLSKQASINLDSIAKNSVSLQHKIVTDVFNKMEEEERRAGKDIKAILADMIKE